MESTRKKVLDKAINIVCKDRNLQYGEPENNFDVIAQYWNCYLMYSGHDGFLSSRDVAMMMALFKIGRETTSHKEDNIVDAIGYLACAEECCGAIEKLNIFINKGDNDSDVT